MVSEHRHINRRIGWWRAALVLVVLPACCLMLAALAASQGAKTPSEEVEDAVTRMLLVHRKRAMSMTGAIQMSQAEPIDSTSKQRGDDIGRAASEEFDSLIEKPAEDGKPFIDNVFEYLQRWRARAAESYTHRVAEPLSGGEQPQASSRKAATQRQPESISEIFNKSPPAEAGGPVLSYIYDWLAKSYRNYQTVIVAKLSTPPPGDAYSPGEVVEVNRGDAIVPPLERSNPDPKQGDEKTQQQAEERQLQAKQEQDRLAAEKLKRQQEAELVEQQKKAARDKLAEQQRLAELERRKAAEALELKKKLEAERAEAEKLKIAAAQEAELQQARDIEAKKLKEAEKLRAEQETIRAAEQPADVPVELSERTTIPAADPPRSNPRPTPPADIAEDDVPPARVAVAKDNDATEPSEMAAKPAPEKRSVIARPVFELSVVERPVIARPAAIRRSSPRLARVYSRHMVKAKRKRSAKFASRRSPRARLYIVRRGDSLWRISRRAYSAGRRYRIVYRANRTVIRNPHVIFPGQRLRLPRRAG